MYLLCRIIKSMSWNAMNISAYFLYFFFAYKYKNGEKIPLISLHFTEKKKLKKNKKTKTGILWLCISFLLIIKVLVFLFSFANIAIVFL